MDGVLFDSMPLHEKSWQETFKSIGIDYPSDMVYLNEGRPGRETIVEVFDTIKNTIPSGNTIEELYQKKTAIMNSYGSAGIIKGMPEIVSHLDRKNYQLCVVTGSSQKSLLNRVNTNYNNSFKDAFITGKDVKKGKPDPEPYLKALQLTGSKNVEALVIENAPLGIKSAKAAGIFTLAINSGKLKAHILVDAGADVVFENTLDLLQWFQDHLN